MPCILSLPAKCFLPPFLILILISCFSPVCFASQCVDEEGNVFDAAVVDNRTQCIDGGHEWVTSFPNFDHTLNGYLSLVHVAIFKGWVPIMYDAVDSRQVSCCASYLNAILFFVISPLS